MDATSENSPSAIDQENSSSAIVIDHEVSAASEASGSNLLEDTAVSQQTAFAMQAPAARSSGLPCFEDPSFACIPDGALLRVVALTDMRAGLAFNGADTVVREGTVAAVRTIAQEIAHAKQNQAATMAAIEQERLAARQHQTAEGAAWAAALDILAP